MAWLSFPQFPQQSLAWASFAAAAPWRRCSRAASNAQALRAAAAPLSQLELQEAAEAGSHKSSSDWAVAGEAAKAPSLAQQVEAGGHTDPSLLLRLLAAAKGFGCVPNLAPNCRWPCLSTATWYLCDQTATAITRMTQLWPHAQGFKHSCKSILIKLQPTACTTT